MTKVISSQRYIDNNIVAAKMAEHDYIVSLSPVITVEGQDYQVVMDGHHSLRAAMLAGATPVYKEFTVQDADTINLICGDGVEGAFLMATHMGDDYYDPFTGITIW